MKGKTNYRQSSASGIHLAEHISSTIENDDQGLPLMDEGGADSDIQGNEIETKDQVCNIHVHTVSLNHELKTLHLFPLMCTCTCGYLFHIQCFIYIVFFT